MELKELNRILREFATKVVQEARANAGTISNTGKLAQSIYFEPNESNQSVSFFMLKYGKYQDLGVKGVKEGVSLGTRYYGKSARDYQYTSKGGAKGLKGMPPAGALDRWSIQKLQLRDKVRDRKGRFIPRKSLVFLIRKKIFEKGIKPSLFFTTPFIKYYGDLPNKVQKAMGNDIEVEITKILKQ